MTSASAVTDRLRPPTSAERAEAVAVVAAHLPPTPLVRTTIPTPGAMLPAELKLEIGQPTGSFKVRGALAALSSLPPGTHAVSASAGNHGLGMAWAATQLARPVTVVTPANASATKLAALRRYASTPDGRVTLQLSGQSYDEAEVAARALVDAHPAGSAYVSSYSDWAVIAGQSSIGPELDAALPLGEEPLTVVTPLGGGGLASGLILWASERPGVRVVAVEPIASSAVGSAVAAGHIVHVDVRHTIADGLAGNLEVGSPTPGIIGAAVSAERARIERVGEEAICDAMRWLFTCHGLVTEGAGAVGIAAVLTGRVAVDGRVVVLVTGRNVTEATYAAVLTKKGVSARPA